MGERTAYDNGAFNWVELGTDDLDGSCDFYSELLGWGLEKHSGGHGSLAIATAGGKKVAMLMDRGEKQAVNAWNSYIAVDDVDATAARASELGGTVAAGPFDLPAGQGRAAFVVDPTGAAVGLLQAGKRHFGAELVNEPGAFSLNQLNTSDTAAARDFYAGLFGWRIEDSQTEGEYWMAYRDETRESMNGGIMPLPEGAEWPSHWIVYFTVADIDEAVTKVEKLGGRIEMPPQEIQTGKIAIAQDPQGAIVALYAGEVDA